MHRQEKIVREFAMDGCMVVVGEVVFFAGFFIDCTRKERREREEEEEGEKTGKSLKADESAIFKVNV